MSRQREGHATAPAAVRTVERTEFAKAPAETLRRARLEGPIVVTDAKGNPRGVLSVTDGRRRS